MKLENGYYWISKPGDADFSILLYKDGDWFDTWEGTWVPDYFIDGAIVEKAIMPTGKGTEFVAEDE